jgi:hypothetical protein
MSTLVTPARNNIYIEGSQFRSAVSEDLLQRFGASINFINAYQYYQFYFGMMGPYSYLSVPATGVGTLEVFDQNATIVNVWVYSGTAGSSSATTVDIQKAPVNSGTFTSIFSTLPSVSSTAASGVIFDANGTATLPTGCTAPVLSTVNFTKGDKLQFNVSSVMGGSPRDLQVQIFWRPR